MDEDTIMLTIIGFILGVGFIIFSIIIMFDYYSSCQEARIFNQQNETNYTCGDFFWAGNQVNQQRQTIKLEK